MWLVSLSDGAFTDIQDFGPSTSTLMRSCQAGLCEANGYDIMSSAMPDTWCWNSKRIKNHSPMAAMWAGHGVEHLNPTSEDIPTTTPQSQDSHYMRGNGGCTHNDSKQGVLVNAVKSSNRMPFGAIENVVKDSRPLQTAQASLHSRAQMTNSGNDNKNKQDLIHTSQSHCDKRMKTAGLKHRGKVWPCCSFPVDNVEPNNAHFDKLSTTYDLWSMKCRFSCSKTEGRSQVHAVVDPAGCLYTKRVPDKTPWTYLCLIHYISNFHPY